MQLLFVRHESLELLVLLNMLWQFGKKLLIFLFLHSHLISSFIDLYICSICLILPPFLHLTFGLHQHLFWGWFNFWQCGQGGKVSSCCLLGPFWFFVLPFAIFLLVFQTSWVLCFYLKNTLYYTISSCLIVLLCSYACKTFMNSARAMVGRSFDPSKADIFNSYFP